MDERQYLQNQINDLATSLEAYKAITQNAIESAGENKQALKALHKRTDQQDLMLVEIQDNQLTEDQIREVMENSVNATIAKGFKTVGLSILAGVVTWVISHFEAIWK